jgi:large subunit ribosomal protein L5
VSKSEQDQKKEKKEKKPSSGASKAATKESKGAKVAKGAAEGKPAKKPSGHQEPSRLKIRYSKEIVPALMTHFKYTNVMAVPKLEKIVINMGLGEAVQNAKILDVAADELGRISGQRPVITRAKKSIANFKLRQNLPIGAAVTLRGERMYEFLDRLTSIVLPRVRDFRGVSTKSFDGRGNYTLGLRDQLIFPEIDYAKVEKIRGMNVTIVTTARTDDEARELLKQLGMPFRQQ